MTVMEKYPFAIGRHDVYMMFGGGQNFAMIGARIQISISNYNDSETKDQIEHGFQIVYDEPYTLTEEQAAGFNKKVLTTIEIKEEHSLGKSLLAFKVQLIGNGENALCTDYYWEGIAVMPARGGFKRK